MRILFLAPQPFFQDRGTPIAVRLAVQVIAERGSDSIDLLTYHEGIDLKIKNTTHYRIKAPKFLKGVRPSISIKKLICDFLFLCNALKLVWKNRHQQYNIVHAVEESAFIAALIKFIFHIPYIYDMDSSIAQQVTEKLSERCQVFRMFLPVLSFFEGFAIKHSLAVIPVCDALADIAKKNGSHNIQILRDISLLDLNPNQVNSNITLQEELNISANSKIILYVGNLESYQGCNLLIDSFNQIAAKYPSFHLVILGGNPEHIKIAQEKVNKLANCAQIHIAGPRPVNSLKDYLLQAEILASPRLCGNNTPMKIYSYLHAGKAIIATDLPTHTQVLTNKVAYLVSPAVNIFASGLEKLILNDTLRLTLGHAAHQLAEERYTFDIFKNNLNALYDKLSQQLNVNDL